MQRNADSIRFAKLAELLSHKKLLGMFAER